MRLDISGHHVEITDSIRQAIKQKISKVASHYPQLDLCTVIITVEKKTQKAEITTQYMGSPITVQASSQELYAALADLAKKFEAKLEHKKGTMKSHLHDKPIIDEPPSAQA